MSDTAASKFSDSVGIVLSPTAPREYKTDNARLPFIIGFVVVVMLGLNVGVLLRPYGIVPCTLIPGIVLLVGRWAFLRSKPMTSMNLDGIWIDQQEVKWGKFEIQLTRPYTADEISLEPSQVDTVEPLDVSTFASAECGFTIQLITSKYGSENYHIAAIRLCVNGAEARVKILKPHGVPLLIKDGIARPLDPSSGHINTNLVPSLRDIADALDPLSPCMAEPLTVLITPRSGVTSASMPFGGVIGVVSDMWKPSRASKQLGKGEGEFVDRDTHDFIVGLAEHRGWQIAVRSLGMNEMGFGNSDW